MVAPGAALNEVEVAYRKAGPLVWRQIDDEWLVYAEHAAGLHRLDALTAVLLDQLEDGPKCVRELSATVQANTLAVQHPDLFELTDKALQILVRAGLAEISLA